MAGLRMSVFSWRTIGGVGRCVDDVDVLVVDADGVVVAEVVDVGVWFGMGGLFGVLDGGVGVVGTEPMMMGIQTEGGREEMNDVDADADVDVVVVAACPVEDDGVPEVAFGGTVDIVIASGFVLVDAPPLAFIPPGLPSPCPYPKDPAAAAEVEAMDPGEGVNADFIASGVLVNGGGSGPPPALTLLFSGGSDSDAPPPPPFLLLPAVTLIPFTCCELA